MTTEIIEVKASPDVIAAWQKHFSAESFSKGGDDGLTVNELSKIAGVTPCTMRARIRDGLPRGIYKQGKGYRPRCDGTLALVNVYQLLKPEEKPSRRKR